MSKNAPIMRVNDKSVLDFLNNFIVKERLNKSQIIQLADIAIVSNDIRDLEENLKWESYIRKHKI